MLILLTIITLFYDNYFSDLYALFYSYSSIKFSQISLLVGFTFAILKLNVALSLFRFITDFNHDILTIFSFEWTFLFFFNMRNLFCVYCPIIYHHIYNTDDVTFLFYFCQFTNVCDSHCVFFQKFFNLK